MESKYHFEDIPGGFIVRAEDRTPVKVTAYPTCLQVELLGQAAEMYTGFPCAFSFYEYYSFSAAIAEGLMIAWKPKEATWAGDKLKAWAQKQTAKAIGKRVYARWQQILAQVDPTVLGVHRAVFAATFGRADGAKVLFDRRLYERPNVVSDIVNYRAAAVAVAVAPELAPDRADRRSGHRQEVAELMGELEALKARARELGVCINSNAYFLEKPSEKCDLIDEMEDWRGLFSHDGRPYRSLNRTLMNLPGGIPASLMLALPLFRLERPYTNRLELLALLCYGQACERRQDREWVHTPIFEHATADELSRAVVTVGEHMHRDLSPRRFRDVREAVLFLADYPDPHRGRIGGLVDKAIEWHRDMQARQIEATVRKLGADTPTARPPILPELPGVRFLDTVEAVCREGAEMGHCVASYARQAVDGSCYLFAVDHNGDRATVEVSPYGKIVQVQGPQNRHNPAAAWARRALAGWAKQAAALGGPAILAQLPEPAHDVLLDEIIF